MTIPKIIHYCWFGGNPLPPLAQKCIASWQKFLPGYEIKRWDESNFDLNSCAYVQEAYQAKKWAFVSDYARFAIVYQYGGLYFDTDVEIIKPLDRILAKGAFMGLEKDVPCRVAPGLGLAANPGLGIYKEILTAYHKHHFIKQDGSLNVTTVVTYTTEILKKYGLKNVAGIQQVAGINIYPKEYFCPKDYVTGELNITPNTVAVHHYTASWHSPREAYAHKLQNKLVKIFSRRISGKIAFAISKIKYEGIFSLICYARKRKRNKSPYKKILIYTFGYRLGDSIVSSFIFRELKRAYPSVHITLMTSAPRCLFEGNPYIDQIIMLPAKSAKCRWKRIFLLPYLFCRRYDVLIGNGNPAVAKSISFYRLICPRKFILLNHLNTDGETRIYRMAGRQKEKCASLQGSVCEVWEEFLHQLGIKTVNTQYELFIASEDKKSVDDFMKQHQLKENHFLIVNPFGSGTGRTLSADKTALLLKKIHSFLPAGYQIVWLDYQNKYTDLETLCIRFIVPDLMQTAWLISLSSTVLTVDTGVLHMADMYHKPLIGLYTLHNHRNQMQLSQLWKPRFSQYKMLYAQNSVNDIPDEEIIEAVKDLL